MRNVSDGAHDIPSVAGGRPSVETRTRALFRSRRRLSLPAMCSLAVMFARSILREQPYYTPRSTSRPHPHNIENTSHPPLVPCAIPPGLLGGMRDRHLLDRRVVRPPCGPEAGGAPRPSRESRARSANKAARGRFLSARSPDPCRGSSLVEVPVNPAVIAKRSSCAPRGLACRR